MTLRLAILSDLHAAPKSDEGRQEVKLFTDQPGASALEDPFRALMTLIQQIDLKADIVVCPGDMTNRANPQALGFVWNGLHQLKGMLGAEAVIATVGNHDVDSRGHLSGSFPRESLMRLRPRFPVENDALADHYWAHGYYIQEIQGVRFLVLNSSWLHEARDDLDRGVVTNYALERLASELRPPSPSQLNIAICHHHPHPHTELGLGADDVMRNGQQFLDLLSDTGHWMVIHGHKHHPKIEYAAGQGDSPIVFACGSFSGRLEGANASVSRNYFHLVELALPASHVKGRVTSWAWASGIGWKQYADAERRFPTELGFGFQGLAVDLAGSISTRLTGKASMPWTQLVDMEPSVLLLMPRQLMRLIKELREQHNLDVVYDELSRPKQIGERL